MRTTDSNRRSKTQSKKPKQRAKVLSLGELTTVVRQLERRVGELEKELGEVAPAARSAHSMTRQIGSSDPSETKRLTFGQVKCRYKAGLNPFK